MLRGFEGQDEWIRDSLYLTSFRSARSIFFVFYEKSSAFSSLRYPFGNHEFFANTHSVFHYVVIVT